AACWSWIFPTAPPSTASWPAIPIAAPVCLAACGYRPGARSFPAPDRLELNQVREAATIHWLFKSEPGVYSWDNLVADKRTSWNGVRNFQASKNMKDMKKGDRVLFYHSGEGPSVVGVCEVAKEYYPDPTDKTGRFGMVDV